ncbi:hypothetical protein C8Q73DRAFT_667603 [Cubamyces lactineus]|nr:hypothetical protein C8Q73DRAFT_667603 [Cubamyces lactineus]
MDSELAARSEENGADGTAGAETAGGGRDEIVWRIVDEALRPAALEAIKAVEARSRSRANTTTTECKTECKTETLPVFVVFVRGSEPGRITGDSPRTVEHWC